ncbi:MAG TPA: YciI family protein [Ideonella sp.]|uniref:YciI family protein n=1 Tax=Ideonella sp. TaxID=1929293 RepID=UPI002C914DDA|nr:YciI family protein [Ideonella sp.]HSI49612.1 YciI family protein [Ideonella sp.]
MRFMIIVKATAETEAEALLGDTALMAEMSTYHQQLSQAGVLLDANGLKPSREGWRIRYGSDASGKPTRQVSDGPFAETKELIAGYTLIQVRSREEAMEWARRFPAPMGAGRPAEIEVRLLYEPHELDDFPRAAAD